MDEQHWTQKLHISLTMIVKSSFFVFVGGVFGIYAFLLYQKEVSSQNILHGELQRLREENYQLLERNQELEQVCAPEADRSPSSPPETSQTILPSSDLERVMQRSFVYTVKKGDTIWDIAAMYNVDVSALMRWNNLSPRSRIFPGDQLMIILEE